MKMSKVMMGFVCFVTVFLAGASAEAALSIHDIQYTLDAAGASDYVGQTVDFAGGIVFHKYEGFRTRLFLYDPASSDGWGGIAVKDLTGTYAFDGISVGDWVSFDGIVVEESSGNTQLSYDGTGGGPTVVSSGNALPEAFTVSVADLVSPPTGGLGEKYEAMYVVLEDVAVGLKDLGKAGDNYELIDAGGAICWGSDYMNGEAGGPYHPLIATGNSLSRISGLVEQYTNPTSGWDYYQLLTLSAADIVPEPATVMLLGGGLAVLVRRRRR
jgi:hypothetical protein